MCACCAVGSQQARTSIRLDVHAERMCRRRLAGSLVVTRMTGASPFVLVPALDALAEAPFGRVLRILGLLFDAFAEAAAMRVGLGVAFDAGAEFPDPALCGPPGPPAGTFVEAMLDLLRSRRVLGFSFHAKGLADSGDLAHPASVD